MANRSNLSGGTMRLMRVVALAAAVILCRAESQPVPGSDVRAPLRSRFSSTLASTSAVRVARSAHHPSGVAAEVANRDQGAAPAVGVAEPASDLPVVPDATYWIVSSRKLPQELPWCGIQPLEVFQRLPEGTLVLTDWQSLRSQIVPGVPVCIFIHGTFVSADLHQRESARTYAWVRRSAPHLPLHVIFYTWPSDTDNTWASPLLVNLRGQWAENNAFYLARMISQLPPECPVCLVGHSHGARAVVSTLHLLGGGSLGGYTFPPEAGVTRRFRAVLAAAAFDRHWLNPGQRYERALWRAEGIVNLRNPGDLALHVYPLRRPFSRKAIGETGFTLWDRARLGPLNARAVDLDVSPFIGLGHTWPYFYSEPRIAAAIVPYTYFADPSPVPAGAIPPPVGQALVAD